MIRRITVGVLCENDCRRSQRKMILQMSMSNNSKDHCRNVDIFIFVEIPDSD